MIKFIELTMVSGKRILIRKDAITEIAEENDRYMLDKGAGCFITVGQNITHVTDKYQDVVAKMRDEAPF